jgi:branched-chain amino acid transport system substrate-binding protein
MGYQAVFTGALACAALFLCPQAHAQKQYEPGVTDGTIKFGQTMPFSGPASSFSTISKVESAYFEMLNATGGNNGRKIEFIALDDAFSPPKAVEQTRRLVENENVVAIVGSMGTSVNVAISKYLNANKVPQLLSASASEKLNDPVNLPWTTTFFLSQQVEAQTFAAWVLENMPAAKVGILYQNDDFGKGYVAGLRAGLGTKADQMVVKEISYDISSPTVDSQLLLLRAAGADVVLLAAIPKFAAQGLAKAKELGWKPLYFVPASTASIVVAMDAVGGVNAAGIMSALFLKSVGDPRWDNDGGMKAYLEFMKKWARGFSPIEPGATMGYSVAEMTTEILKRCGDDLSRENLLKQATNIHEFQLSMFIPGVTVSVSPEDHGAIRKLQMAKFDGQQWTFMGGVTGPAR